MDTTKTPWDERIGRNFWWIGAATMLLCFNLLLLGSALGSERVWWQFDIDGTRRDCEEGLKIALLYGNIAFSVVTLLSSLLAFFVLVRPCHLRRAKIFLLGLTGLIFWGALLSVGWKFEALEGASGLPPAFAVNVVQVLFIGLPLLWSLALILIGWRWQED